MISLELEAGADPMELSRDEQFVALVQGSVAEWDARLTYTRGASLGTSSCGPDLRRCERGGR